MLKEYLDYQNVSVIEMGVLDNTVSLLRDEKAKLED